MSTQHTKGPWREYAPVLHSKPRLKEIHIVALDRTVCCTYSDTLSEGEEEIQEANARLIAAAPELLDALNECMAWLDRLVEKHGEYYRGPQLALCKAVDAISKASAAKP